MKRGFLSLKQKREFGRLGYDTPVAQPTTFHLKPLHIDDANYDACDDPGGDIDDPGGGSTNEEGSFNSFTTSASTFSKDTCVVCLLFFNDQSLFAEVAC